MRAQTRRPEARRKPTREPQSVIESRERMIELVNGEPFKAVRPGSTLTNPDPLAVQRSTVAEPVRAAHGAMDECSTEAGVDGRELPESAR